MMLDFLRSSSLGLALAAGLVLAAAAQPGAPSPAPSGPVLGAERTALRLPRLAERLARGEDVHIVAFGSSSTEGAGASSREAAYPALLERDLAERLQVGAATRRRVAVVNRGKGGDDSEAMARRLARDVVAERPDLVVWQTGSNDPMTGVPVERFVQLTREGIAAIRATGADVILMDQQWCRRLEAATDAERYEDALHALAAELRVPVIERNALMQTWAATGLLTPAQMIGPDGLHMTDASYRQLAKAAATQILAGAGLAQPALARR